MTIKKYIFIGLGILFFSYYIYNNIYNIGYNAGFNKVTQQWEKDKANYQSEFNKLKQEYLLKEEKYKKENLSIVLELNEAKQKYEKDLISINNSFNNKLLLSEQRATVYRNQAKAGEVERENLATHAAQLDKTLTEGQQVVRELRSGIELRDNTIEKLIAQLKNDRKLLENE